MSFLCTYNLPSKYAQRISICYSFTICDSFLSPEQNGLIETVCVVADHGGNATIATAEGMVATVVGVHWSKVSNVVASAMLLHYFLFIQHPSLLAPFLFTP